MINKVGFIHVYNKIAPLYDAIFGRSCTDAYSLVLDVMNRYKLEMHSLLDVGCGTGSFLQLVSEQLPVQSLYGIDPSIEMISLAQKKQVPNCTFHTEFIEHTSIADHSMDCIVSTTAFSHFFDIEKAMAQIHRVLKGSGHCIIVEHKKPQLIVETLLKWIRILADYREVEELRSIFNRASFQLVELQETKKYVVAYITPI